MEEAADIKQMFHMMDKDNNGSLTLEELKEGLQIIGDPVPEPDIKMLLEAVSDLAIRGFIHSWRLNFMSMLLFTG